MARRLAPDARRAEIIRRARELIATQGASGMSLRSVARWCDMSAPGVLHYFAGLRPLLEAVLTERDAEELAMSTEFVRGLGENATLHDLVEGLLRYRETHDEETRNFDALETEAVASPDHPAHDYFVHQARRPFPVTLELAAREYIDPETVAAVLRVVTDGLRMRWLRSNTRPDYRGDWEQIRDTVFAGFEPLRKPAGDPATRD